MPSEKTKAGVLPLPATEADRHALLRNLDDLRTKNLDLALKVDRARKEAEKWKKECTRLERQLCRKESPYLTKARQLEDKVEKLVVENSARTASQAETAQKLAAKSAEASRLKKKYASAIDDLQATATQLNAANTALKKKTDELKVAERTIDELRGKPDAKNDGEAVEILKKYGIRPSDLDGVLAAHTRFVQKLRQLRDIVRFFEPGKVGVETIFGVEV